MKTRKGCISYNDLCVVYDILMNYLFTHEPTKMNTILKPTSKLSLVFSYMV